MARNVYQDIEWFFNPNTYWKEYGLLNLSGKWAVVKAKGFHYIHTTDEEGFDVVTDWLDDRKTAIGFLKLLKEN